MLFGLFYHITSCLLSLCHGFVSLYTICITFVCVVGYQFTVLYSSQADELASRLQWFPSVVSICCHYAVVGFTEEMVIHKINSNKIECPLVTVSNSCLTRCFVCANDVNIAW